MSYNFTDFLKKKNEKNLNEMTNQEIYYKLLEYVKERADEKTPNKSKKKIYYISAEFLIGKLLSNNLINLGIYKEVREELKAAGNFLDKSLRKSAASRAASNALSFSLTRHRCLDRLLNDIARSDL